MSLFSCLVSLENHTFAWTFETIRLRRRQKGRFFVFIVFVFRDFRFNFDFVFRCCWFFFYCIFLIVSMSVWYIRGGVRCACIQKCLCRWYSAGKKYFRFHFNFERKKSAFEFAKGGAKQKEKRVNSHLESTNQKNRATLLFFFLSLFIRFVFFRLILCLGFSFMYASNEIPVKIITTTTYLWLFIKLQFFFQVEIN